MKENPEPVKEPHIAFARAVVALAREHGCGFVDLRFRLASSRFFREERSDYTTVRAQWAEGRRGAGGQITLDAEAVVRIGVYGIEVKHDAQD